MGNVRDEIANNLLYYRKKIGLTQIEFAKRLGVNNSAVSNWEHGTNSIDIDMLHLACDILGVSVNDMFGIHSNAKAGKYSQAEKRIIDFYRSLNDEGQEKIIDYIDDLVRSGKYIKNSAVEVGESKRV
jgi:transcriptional regulator with XRE-family HTH domain